MKLAILGIALALLVPGAQATCTAEFTDPSGDTAPPLLPGFYDLRAITVDWANNTLDWSWNASSMSIAVNVLFYGGFVVAPIDPEIGQPLEGTGDPFFHPGCDRHIGLDGIPGTYCDLTKSPSNQEGSVVSFEFVSLLNWTQSGDLLTVHIPTSLIGLGPGMGLVWSYGATAISISFDAELVGNRASPVYPDETTSWNWPACWAPIPNNPVETVVANKKETPSLALTGLVFALSLIAVARRRL